MTLSEESYGRVKVLPSMNEPVRYWSMQPGGYVFIRQGDNRIRLGEDDLAQILLVCSLDFRVEHVEYADDDSETWTRVAYHAPVSSRAGDE
jgi:hypothetical protein